MSLLHVEALPELKKDNTPEILNSHILPKHPSRVIFSAPSNSGKTNLIVNMLVRKDMYRDFFKHIIIVSPNLHSDAAYQHIHHYAEQQKKRKKKDRVNFMLYTAFDPAEGEKLLEQIREAVEAKQKKPILILLDDILGDPKLLKSTFLTVLASMGRHYSISLWISVQSYMKVDRTIRLNITDLIQFRFANRSELDRVYDEQIVDMDKHLFEQLCSYVFGKMYTFLTIKKTAAPGKNLAICFEHWVRKGNQGQGESPK